MKSVGPAVVIPFRPRTDALPPQAGQGEDAEMPGDEETPSSAFCEILSNCLDKVEDLLSADDNTEDPAAPADDESDPAFAPDFAFFGTLLGRITARFDGLDEHEADDAARASVDLTAIDPADIKAHARDAEPRKTPAGLLDGDAAMLFAAETPLAQDDASAQNGRKVVTLHPPGEPSRSGQGQRAVDGERQSAAAARPQDMAAGSRKPAVETLDAREEAHERPAVQASAGESSGTTVTDPSAAAVNRPSSPQPTPDRVASVAQQVAAGASHALSQITDPGEASMKLIPGMVRIKLHPEELGSVEITVRLNKSRLEVRVVPERDETARLLQDGQNDLLRALTGAAQGTTKVDVVVGTQASTTSQQGSLSEGGQQRPDWTFGQQSGGGSGERSNRNDGRSMLHGYPGAPEGPKEPVEDLPHRRRSSPGAIYV